MNERTRNGRTTKAAKAERQAHQERMSFRPTAQSAGAEESRPLLVLGRELSATRLKPWPGTTAQTFGYFSAHRANRLLPRIGALNYLDAAGNAPVRTTTWEPDEESVAPTHNGKEYKRLGHPHGSRPAPGKATRGVTPGVTSEVTSEVTYRVNPGISQRLNLGLIKGFNRKLTFGVNSGVTRRFNLGVSFGLRPQVTLRLSRRFSRKLNRHITLRLTLGLSFGVNSRVVFHT